MSKELIARLRAQRELKVNVGKFVFIVERPTDAAIMDQQRRQLSNFEMVCEQVRGWQNVSEDDVVGGGGTDAVVFSPELWREWASDRVDFWGPIAEALLAAYTEHARGLETVEKN